MKRAKVNPGTTIPASVLGQREDSINMAKWGNRFKIPYEVMRVEEVRINKVAAMVELDSITETVRLFDELCYTLEHGDGTTGSAAKVNSQSDFASGTTAGTLSVKAFSNFIDEAFTAPHYCTHVLLLKDAIRDLKEGISANTGDLVWMQLFSMGLVPELESMDPRVTRVRFGRANEGAISANKLIGLDPRFGVEMVNQQGADIREQAKIIKDQTEELTVSNTYLWAKLEFGAVQVLDYGA